MASARAAFEKGLQELEALLKPTLKEIGELEATQQKKIRQIDELRQLLSSGKKRK
jgi:hypothetical protein